jgi:hypothetical protein
MGIKNNPLSLEQITNKAEKCAKKERLCNRIPGKSVFTPFPQNPNYHYLNILLNCTCNTFCKLLLKNEEDDHCRY